MVGIAIAGKKKAAQAAWGCELPHTPMHITREYYRKSEGAYPQDGVDPLDGMFALSPDGVHAATYDSFTLSKTQNAGFIAVEILGRDLSWSADGSRLVYHTEQGIWLRDVASGTDELVVPGVSPYTARLCGISPDNRYVAYQTDEGIFIVDTLENHPRMQTRIREYLSRAGSF